MHEPTAVWGAGTLRLLIVDESEDDARLIVRELHNGGCEVVWERVETASALAAALQRQPWDAVTCEWHLPQCSHAVVLTILKEHGVDLPVIVVSGQVDEALSVTALGSGAHDFVNKRQLARLGPAIEREVRAAALRRNARRVEQELRLGSEIATHLSEGVFLISTVDQRIVFTNARFDQMFGYLPGELIGKHVSVVNAPTEKSPEETAREITAALARDRRWQGEVFNRKKDGSSFWHHASVSTFEHPEFGPVWVSVHQDIEHRKRAEGALRQSDERFRTIFEEAPMGVALIDSLTGRICEANARYAAIAGRTRAQIVTIDWMSITHPDDLQENTDKLALLHAGTIPGFVMDKRYIRPDGSCVWIQLTAARVTAAEPQHPRHLAMIEDITERKRLHEEILRTTSFLDSIVENIPNMVFVKEAENLTFALFNRAGEELLGHRRADLIGRNDHDFFPKEEADFFTDKDRAVLRDKTLLDIPEEPINTGQRGQRILHTKKIPILDEHGEPAYLLGISEDITERKRAEEALRESEERYRSLVTATSQMVWTTDAQGEVVDASPSWLAYTGQTEQEIRGRGWMAALHPDDRARTDATWADAISARHRYEIEYRVRRHDGEYRDFAVRGVPVLSKDGTIREWVGACIDVTELKRAREQLHAHQAELAHVLRVNTMGEMAAELAHEINQPISAIANYAQGCCRLIASGATTPGELLPVIGEIAAQALRAGEVIRHLRKRLQKHGTRYEETDLNTVVTNAVRVLAPQARQLGTPIRVDLDPELPLVQVDRIQIEQVIVNLMLNAIEAMKMGGSSEPELSVHTALTGDGIVEVSVRDRGTGITPAISERMFEPFYSSKSSGLGMGLSISRSIVVDGHGGRLWATNNTCGGATFHFALPLRRDASVRHASGRPTAP